MRDEFHKPTKFSGSKFEAYKGGEDPAQISRVAHETANALLARVRNDPDPEVVDRLVAFTDENGIDAIAELWARANPEEPAGRALAHLPDPTADPAGSGGHQPSCSSAAPR